MLLYVTYKNVCFAGEGDKKLENIKTIEHGSVAAKKIFPILSNENPSAVTFLQHLLKQWLLIGIALPENS